MELGNRLRQARLEAGLSQRQLCGDVITRNMLSQIENGSANPSMETLQYFARQLGKPVSYFLAEEVLASPNQSRMPLLRQASPKQVLELLESYESPDPLFDPERYLLEMLSCMALAQTAIEENKMPYARKLLEQAQQAAARTPYDTEDLRRRRALLSYGANGASAAQLAQQLPSLDEELLLRAQGALAQEDVSRCRALLEAAENKDARWHLCMGTALMAQGEYAAAAKSLQEAERELPQQVYGLLERCYTALEDYKMAYEYVCKQRSFNQTD